MYRGESVKVYKIYIYSKGEFVFDREATTMSEVFDFVKQSSLRFKFIRVENHTVYNRGKHAGEDRLVNTSVFIGGELVHRDTDILPQDMDGIKEKLPRVYMMNTVVRYYPAVPFTCYEIKEMLGIPEDEWFTMKVVKDEPERYAAVFYDLSQYKCSNRRRRNNLASSKLGVELYGNVLYINENLIS